VLHTANRFLSGRNWQALVSFVQKQDGPVQPAKGFQVSNLVHISLSLHGTTTAARETIVLSSRASILQWQTLDGKSQAVLHYPESGGKS